MSSKSIPLPQAAQLPTPRPDSPPSIRGARIDALYLHLPFCFHKCHYCDFYSVVDRQEDRQADFTDALLAELRERCEQTPLRPSTVFAGGGTPTYLRPELWARLLDAMHQLGVLDDAVEFTVEANPETVTPELMAQLADGGVNRVSIGAQSFDRQSLAALERWHDPDNVARAVDACRAAGLTNFSLDLIFAIPGQTLDMLDADLDRLVDLAPTHLSTYGLTFEPNTPLTARLRTGQVAELDEDTQRQMYQRVLDRLADAGFEHYEISNWARAAPEPRPGQPATDYRCAHNLAYWQNRNWLGLGPAAASHVDGRRWRNAPNLTTYLQTAPAPPVLDDETLEPDDRIGEQFMLGLRLSQGIARGWVNAHTRPGDRRQQQIDHLIAIGMLQWQDEHLRLTRAGLFVGDSVMAQLL